MQDPPKCAERSCPDYVASGCLKFLLKGPNPNEVTRRYSTLIRHQGILAVEDMSTPEIRWPQKGMLVHVFTYFNVISDQPGPLPARTGMS